MKINNISKIIHRWHTDSQRHLTFKKENYALRHFKSRDTVCLASKDVSGDEMHGNSVSGREYGKIVVNTTQTISELQGFYIWGKYESSRLWRTIYLFMENYLLG